MNRTEKLKRFGKGMILIGLLARVLIEVLIRNGGKEWLNSDSVPWLEAKISFGLLVIIGYGIRIWADCRKEKADSRKSDSKADES